MQIKLTYLTRDKQTFSGLMAYLLKIVNTDEPITVKSLDYNNLILNLRIYNILLLTFSWSPMIYFITPTKMK